MRVPARFLRLSSTHNGAHSKEGWLEIDIRALDLDGVTKLYLDLADLTTVKTRRDDAAAQLGAWDAVFGKAEDDGPPPQ